jgi:peptide/nickel transport system substrate-binding protein
MTNDPKHERTTRRRRWLPVATIAVVSSLALVAAACGTGSGDSADGGVAPGSIPNELEADETPVRGGKLVVAVPAETNGWNPSINQWADAGAMVASSIVEPLAVLDKEGNPEMFLAESITPANDEFTQWDIKVKPGIEFHNGQKLDAEAVKENLEATFKTGLTSIAMAPMYDRVEITDPATSVRVYLNKPWAQYPQGLASGASWMLAHEQLAHENDQGEVDGGVFHPIGTGPFVFQEWRQNDSFKARKFDKYWRKADDGSQLPYLDEIEFRPIVDDAGKEQALGSGDVDMIYTTSAEVASRMSANFEVIRDYTSERTFVMLNTAVGDLNEGNPFTNVHARRALAYATDRAQIADLVGTGVQITTQGYRPDSQWHVAEGNEGYYSYDPAKAKEEVELYKADTGADALAFTLSGLTNIDDTTLMQALQAQWKEAGIDARIDQIDQVKYISTIALGGFQAAWFRWYGNPDPDANYVFNAAETAKGVGGVNINFTQYTSPGMQANLEEGRTTTDQKKRKVLNDKVVKEINEQALAIWLFDTPYSLIADPEVRGLNDFRTRPFGNFLPKPYWADVWMKTDS